MMKPKRSEPFTKIRQPVAQDPNHKCYDHLGRVNVRLSTITFDGHAFPACILVCPPSGDQDPLKWEDRVLGGQGNSAWDLHIPMENGFLVQVTRSFYSPPNPRAGWAWSLAVYSRKCFLRHETDGDIWLPMYGDVIGNEIFTEKGPDMRGTFSWNFGEEPWMAEHIERLGTMTAHHDKEGPDVEVCKLDRIEWVMPDLEGKMWRAGQ